MQISDTDAGDAFQAAVRSLTGELEARADRISVDEYDNPLTGMTEIRASFWQEDPTGDVLLGRTIRRQSDGRFIACRLERLDEKASVLSPARKS
jgi:hypothetical protein